MVEETDVKLSTKAVREAKEQVEKNEVKKRKEGGEFVEGKYMKAKEFQGIDDYWG